MHSFPPPRPSSPSHTLLCRRHRPYRKPSDFSNSFSLVHGDSLEKAPDNSSAPFTQPSRNIRNYRAVVYYSSRFKPHTHTPIHPHTHSVHHVKRRHANVINHFPFENERTVYRHRNAKDFSAGGKRIYIATPLSTLSVRARVCESSVEGSAERFSYTYIKARVFFFWFTNAFDFYRIYYKIIFYDMIRTRMT